MADITVICPNCRQSAVADEAAAASVLRCPACGLLFLADGRAAAGNQSSAPPVVASLPARTTPALVLSPQAEKSKTDPPALRAADQPRPRGFGPLEVIKVVLGGAAGLGIAYLLIFWIQNRPRADKPRGETPLAKAPSSSQPEMKPTVTFPEIRRSADPAPAPPPFIPAGDIGFGGPQPQANSSLPEPPAPQKGKGKRGKGKTPPPAASPPPATAAPMPPPPKPAEPLSGLAAALKIPPVVDTAPANLSPLHLPEGKTLGISFNAAAANVPAEAAFVAERHEPNSSTWQILYTPNASGPADKRILATLSHEGGALKFAWRLPIEDAEIRQELANCLIRLTCDNVVKVAPLRAPVETPRLSIDLNRDTTTQSLPGIDAPKEDALRLEITELRGFPAGAKMEKDKRLLKLKERTTILFEQLPGAEIQVDFRRPASGDFQVVLRPEFHENVADKFSMTLSRLDGLKKGLEKSIPEGEAEIRALTKQLELLDSDLRGMGQAPTGAAYIAWQAKRVKLESAISSGKRKISRLQRSLPEMKARLARVPSMQQFLQDIHRNASLVVRIVAECGDGRIVLVDASRDPPSGQNAASGN